MSFSRRLITQFLAPDDPPAGGGGGGDGGGSGSGGNAGGNTDPGAGGGGSTQNPPSGAGNGGQGSGSGSGSGGGTGRVEFNAEQQSEIDRIVAKRLSEDRDRRKKEQDAEDAKKRGEFEKLYGDEKSRADGLAAFKDRCEDYEKRFNQSIDDETKDWPEEVKSTDPGKDDVSVRLEWVEKNRKLAAKLKSLDAPPNGEPGNQGGGQGGGAKDAASGYIAKRYSAVPDFIKPK